MITTDLLAAMTPCWSLPWSDAEPDMSLLPEPPGWFPTAPMPSAGERAPWQLEDEALLTQLQLSQKAASSMHAAWLSLLDDAERRQASVRVHGVPTASWLAAGTTHSARSARAEVRLAGLVADVPPVAEALAAGRVSVEQATVIAHGLGRIPDLERGRRDAVAAHLVELAGEFNPDALRRLVNHAVDVVAPEVAEAADAAALERAERTQRGERRLTWRRDHDGGLVFSGKLPSVAGEMFTAHLSALACQQRAADAVSGVDTTQAQALADALALAVGHHADCEGGPVRGGDATRVLVTVGLDALRSGLGGALLLGSDEQVSAGQARRLACAAGILPVVLGGGGQPLDVGREHRLFTIAQRAALALRDGGCSFPGCDRPPSDCEAHHVVPWWAGGTTDVANGVLLCPHHHHLVEPNPNLPDSKNWRIALDARGRPRFTAPASRDGTRITRQHHRYRI